MINAATRFGVLALVLAQLLVLTGCASTQDPRDPLQGFNRAMFGLNDAIDQAALKPAAKAYQSVLPSFAQTAIGNFFGNLADIPTAMNNLLQGKVADGLSDVMRVAVNSTIGLGGLIDVGSEARLTKHKEDFGQTLGKWGVAPGPYVVLPFLGSSTLRDTVALPVDYKTDLWTYKDPVRWRRVGSVVRIIDQRAAALDASNLIEEAALDKYEFVRDAYLQRRESKVRDGEDSKSAPKGNARPAPRDDSSMNQHPASESMPAAASASGTTAESNPDQDGTNGDAANRLAASKE
jgi:phospholipid-binding lipoprotein MlaA